MNFPQSAIRFFSTRFLSMKKVTSFFLFCSGAEIRLLEQCPSEINKYMGIGATVFFTGIFASLAAGYALFTVFDNYWISALLGLVWGTMIFNLDRFIVSSMRKDGKFGRELLMASPRIVLAVIISIVIAKPLELKIFQKEIAPELIVMEQEVFARQENLLKSRYQQKEDSLKRERTILLTESRKKTEHRDALMRAAQEEADGTGGSKKKNLGPIYKVKKADADRADLELREFNAQITPRLKQIDQNLFSMDETQRTEIASIERKRMDGPAARLEALSRITENSSAMALANIFILLLFIVLETSPVIVKLLSPKGPYDNLLKIEEHTFSAKEIEALAETNSNTKERASGMSQQEKEYIHQRLDALLKRSSG
jgi:hypothetical protein